MTTFQIIIPELIKVFSSYDSQYYYLFHLLNCSNTLAPQCLKRKAWNSICKQIFHLYI
jgi:hypothetical protein